MLLLRLIPVLFAIWYLKATSLPKLLLLLLFTNLIYRNPPDYQHKINNSKCYKSYIIFIGLCAVFSEIFPVSFHTRLPAFRPVFISSRILLLLNVFQRLPNSRLNPNRLYGQKWGISQ